MMANYAQRHHNIKGVINDLEFDAPELIRNFGRLHHDVLMTGVLPGKFKELMALGMAIVLRCQNSISYQMHDAIKAGASKEEILETIGVAVLMGGSPSMMCATDAYRAYHQIINNTRDYGKDDTILEDELLGE